MSLVHIFQIFFGCNFSSKMFGNTFASEVFWKMVFPNLFGSFFVGASLRIFFGRDFVWHIYLLR